jgi:hypothetical protein
MPKKNDKTATTKSEALKRSEDNTSAMIEAEKQRVTMLQRGNEREGDGPKADLKRAVMPERRTGIGVGCRSHRERTISMTQQSGRYGYKPNERNGMSEQAIDKTRELAEEALDRADEWLKPTGLSIKERPMTVLAVVGGLAFAAGAIWMLRNSRQQSRYQEMLGTLSDLPRRAGWR